MNGISVFTDMIVGALGDFAQQSSDRAEWLAQVQQQEQLNQLMAESQAQAQVEANEQEQLYIFLGLSIIIIGMILYISLKK